MPGRLKLEDCLKKLRDSEGGGFTRFNERHLIKAVKSRIPKGGSGLAESKQVVQEYLRMIDEDLAKVTQALEQPEVAPIAQKPTESVEAPPAAQQTPEPAKAAVEPTVAPETKAEQPPAAKTSPQTGAPLVPTVPETLDPHWAYLGKTDGYTEGDLRTELKETPEYERTQIQQALGAKDNSPQTLAKALKALQPRTGGQGSAYQTEVRERGARRDAIDEQLDREEGIVRSRRRSMRSGRVLYSGVTKEAASTAQGALLNLLPTARGAWIGTSKEVKDAPGLRQSFIQTARLRDSGLSLEDADERFNQFADSLPDSRMEGFTVGGRQYVLIDGVGVTEEDGSPERAVRRVMIHEDAHEAVEAAIESDPALQAEWDGIKSEISAEDLDSLAASRYPWMKGWRTDPETFNDLAHEWIAEQMEILEKSGEPPQGLLKRIMDFFRKILARAMGEPEADVTDQRVIDFIEAGRAARAREHRMANPVRPSQQNLYPEGFGVPEMPEGSAKLITHKSPYPGMTSEKIAAYAWPRFYAAWNSHRADPDGPLTAQEKSKLEADWKANLKDENAMEYAADNAYSEERMARANFGLYSPEPSQTAPETGPRQTKRKASKAPEVTPEDIARRFPRFSMQPVSNEQDAAYMRAVESGDMETAQRMVDEAAKAAGYNEFGVHRSRTKGITEFNKDKRDTRGPSFASDGGFYFANDSNDKTAEVFGAIQYPAHLRITNPAPVEIHFRNDPYGLRPQIRVDIDGRLVDPERITKKDVSDLKAKGYDGIIWKGDPEVTAPPQKVAFDSNQIKSADPVTRDAQGNVIPLSQRFNTRSSDIRFSMQPSYSSQSEERESDYKEATAAMPESGREYVQFLGSLTRTPKVAQAVRPMVDFARSLLGSYQGDEIEVNADNTERVKDLAAQAFQKGKPGSQFAEDISEQFRQSGFSNNGQHQGSVMAGVLQMEILDYAVRLAGEGDRSLALALMPYANDVAASDHASISNFGRGLQMRSMAGQQKGFWTILNSLAKGERELAEKNPIYKELREDLFSDEVKAETAAAVEKDMDSAEAQKALDPNESPEDLLDAYLGRALGIMDQAERDITIKLFTDMAELELLLKKQEDLQTPKDIKASMQAARDLNDPVAIQQRIDELKSSISKGLKALDKFKTSEATKETRQKALSKTPKAKKAMSADADAKKMLDRLENKDKRTKKEPAPWKKTYTDQIQNPKSEEDFTAEMLKHGVSPSVSRKLFDAAETASAELSKKAKEKARQAEKGPAQAFSAWVGGAEQDGIEDFVDLVAKNITAAGFNETGFRRALANKFDKVDPDLIDATTERVKAKLDEQDAEEKDAPKPPDYDARAKKLVTNAISKKSGAEQAKLKDPMTEAIKARMKGDIDAAGLKGRLLSLGIESETVFAVGRKVEEDLADKVQEDAKRKSKALAEKLAREAAMPTKTADQLIDELDAQQTEWLAKGKPKNPIRELAAKARKAPDQTKGPTTFPTWEEFTKQFIALGVNPTRAAVLVSRLRAENAKDRANRVIRKRESASNSKAFVNSVMRDIFGATLEEQADPAWRRQTMVNAFMRNGMNLPEAQKAADWLEYRFSTHLKTAQEKAAQKAAKDLKMKKPTLEKLVKAIRSRAVDPLNTDPVTKALAEEAGFAGITPAQFTELAKLDGQMRGPYQSQRAKAAARMLDIALAAKPPKSKAEILTQAWISSALSSISTMSLSAVHAGFIPARRLVTDFAAIAMDVTTGKTKPADAAQLMVNTLSNMQEAARNMLATAKFAGVNDAYTQHIVEFINQMHSMQADLQRAVQTFKDPNSTGAQKGLAAIKIAFTSTDIVRRILSTADETWGAMLQDFILRNEAMRTLVQKGNLSPTAAAMLFTAASNEGRIAAEKHLNETGNQVEAQLIARDATQNALLQAVRETVGDKAAEDVGTTANLESPMELGNRRSEDAPLWDIANTGLEWVKQLAIATRRKNELAGRMITGFVTVPANILNRSASFTPLGLARTLYKMKGNPEKTAKFYEETMKTEGQQRMRLIEGITGTLLITALLALTGGDDDEGLVITGSGPEDRGLREAWMKKGNQPNRIEWKDKNGNVRWSVPYARGGFDHLNLPFTLVGTMDDMRLKGIKPRPANVEWGTQYMHTALKGLFDQAKFFGLKNVASMPTQNLTDKSLASQAAYLAAPVLPWSGLTKSLGRMWTGPTDQSSVRSAVLAQLPFTNFYATPSLNALGDQRGAAPTDARWEKSAMSGNPFLILAENKGPDADLYSMMIERGVAPNVPLRSNLERVNGFIPDAKWEQYLRTRGALIKQGIRKNLRALKLLPHKDAQNLIERISADSTRAAKAKVGLE